MVIAGRELGSLGRTERRRREQGARVRVAGEAGDVRPGRECGETRARSGGRLGGLGDARQAVRACVGEGGRRGRVACGRWGQRQHVVEAVEHRVEALVQRDRRHRLAHRETTAARRLRDQLLHGRAVRCGRVAIARLVPAVRRGGTLRREVHAVRCGTLSGARVIAGACVHLLLVTLREVAGRSDHRCATVRAAVQLRRVHTARDRVPAAVQTASRAERRRRGELRSGQRCEVLVRELRLGHVARQRRLRIARGRRGERVGRAQRL